MCKTPEQQLAEIMAVLDQLKVPQDPDPVNRFKRLTAAFVNVADSAKKLAKAAKCLKYQAKMGRGW